MKKPQHRGWLIAAAVVLLAPPLAAQSGYPAQCDQNQIDSITVMLDGTTSIPSARITAAALIEMPYDSGYVRYKIAEFRKNGARIKWTNWCYGRRARNWTEGQFADSTRTQTFSMSTGDTLSFSREFSWANPTLSSVAKQSWTNFYAADTLDYVVELVNANTGLRSALIDSFGVLRRTTSGAPTFYGTRPIVTKAQFVVPSGLNGSTGFLRFRPRARGSGSYYFMRYDELDYGMSYTLGDSAWINYLSEFGGGLSKQRSGDAQGTLRAVDGSYTLRVGPNPTEGQISVTFDFENRRGNLGIAVYDATGALVFVPFMRNAFEETSGEVVVKLDRPGKYFVSMFANKELLGTQAITVVR